MRPAQFMAHVYFQQKVSEYRTLSRELDQAVSELRAFPDEEEEEINARVSARIERLYESSHRIESELHAFQKGAVCRAGVGVQQ